MGITLDVTLAEPLAELAEHELPVVAPLKNSQGESLFEHGGFHFTLFPRQGGHAPEFDNLHNLFTMGRLMGRIHLIGACRPFQHRPQLDSQSFGHQSVKLISEQFIPPEYKNAYDSLTADLMQTIDDIISRVATLTPIRRFVSRPSSGCTRWIAPRRLRHSSRSCWSTAPRPRTAGVSDPFAKRPRSVAVR